MEGKNSLNPDRGNLNKVQIPEYTMGSEDIYSKDREAMYALFQDAHSGKIDTSTLYKRGTALTSKLKGGNGKILPEDLRYACDFIRELKYSPEKDRKDEVNHYLELFGRDNPRRTDFLARLNQIRKEYRDRGSSSGQLYFQLDELRKEFDNYANKIAESIGDLEAECEDDTEMILHH